ncbi:P22 phage major capsid protein family protein, partial [Klebsiella pneumoniae]|uniref:P22 phage major capsid protein family protein n=1 Tax=Klebsiella pneumoniae TaxID=573 RepID=UPI0029354143
ALTTQFGVDMSFSSADLALSIDDFSNRFIKPAIATVANKIDYDGLQLYKTVSNSVGTPGTVPNAFLTYLQAGVLLDNNATP